MSRDCFPRFALVGALAICAGFLSPAALAGSLSHLSPSKALSLESESGTFQTGTHESRTVCPVRITSQYRHVFHPGVIGNAKKQISQQDELGKPQVAAEFAHRYARTVAWCYGHQTKGLSGDQSQAVRLAGDFLLTYAEDYDKAYKGKAGLDSSALAQAKIGRSLLQSESASPARNKKLARIDKIIKAWDKESHMGEDAQKKIDNAMISQCVSDAKLGIDMSSCNQYPAYRAAVKAAKAKLKKEQAHEKAQQESNRKRACMSYARRGADLPQYHCSQYKGFTKTLKAGRKRMCSRLKAIKAPTMPAYCTQGGGG